MPAHDQEKMLADLRAFDDYYQKQLNLIEQLSKLAVGSKGSKDVKSVYPLFGSLVSAAHSIIFMTRSGLMTESYIIAKTYLERVVNTCYLIVCDNEDREEYINFSIQKIQDALGSRKKTYESLADRADIPMLSNIPKAAKRSVKYTKTRSNEICRWTTLPVEKRIAFIKSRCPEFNDALFLDAARYISGDASEATRGTLYGALFHTGMFFGAHNPVIGENYLNGLRQMMYMLLGGLVEGLLSTASKELAIDTLLSESKKNYSELLQHAKQPLAP
jgi:hypothetical protein